MPKTAHSSWSLSIWMSSCFMDVLSAVALQDTTERVRPAVLQLRDAQIELARHLPAPHIDHKPIAAHGADPLGRDTLRCRQLEDTFGVVGLDGQDHARLALAEQDRIASKSVGSQSYHSAKRFPRRRDAGFRERDGEPAVRAVMR